MPSQMHHLLQVRALTVCRAWKEHLDPRQFPIPSLWLPCYDEAEDLRIAEWITITRPALRALRLWDLPTPQLLLALSSVEPRTVDRLCRVRPGTGN